MSECNQNEVSAKSNRIGDKRKAVTGALPSEEEDNKPLKWQISNDGSSTVKTPIVKTPGVSALLSTKDSPEVVVDPLEISASKPISAPALSLKFQFSPGERDFSSEASTFVEESAVVKFPDFEVDEPPTAEKQVSKKMKIEAPVDVSETRKLDKQDTDIHSKADLIEKKKPSSYKKTVQVVGEMKQLAERMTKAASSLRSSVEELKSIEHKRRNSEVEKPKTDIISKGGYEAMVWEKFVEAATYRHKLYLKECRASFEQFLKEIQSNVTD